LKKLIDNYKDEYLDSLLEIKGYSELTYKTYEDALNEAFEILQIEEFENKKILNLMPYRLKIANQNPKTISKKLSAIRGFVNYLNDNGLNIFLKADDSIKVAKTLPKPVSHKYIKEALQEATLEEKLVVIMLYTLGLRISELSNLELKNISNEWIRVDGKGNKQRDVPLLKSTEIILNEYIETYMPKKYLFEKNRGKLSENSLRYIVNKVFKKVGLKVTPHQLRHSYATELLNSGAPIVDVSELLGHASMATTQIYTKLGSALKEKNYNKAHPLAGI
jgi:integrase/recombinase XerC